MALKVAVVGSGPAGFYAADALLKSDDPQVEVDVIDRLPTPWGLVRLGVAPDHENIKAVSRAFNVALPEQVPDGLATLVLGVLIPVFALLKAITDDFVHWPAWIGVILGAVIAYGAWQVFAASGEKLPSMPARDTTT
jgi:hypothetical protein